MHRCDKGYHVPMVPRDGYVLGYVFTHSTIQDAVIDLQCNPPTSSLLQSIFGSAVDINEFMNLYWRYRPMHVKGSARRIKNISKVCDELSILRYIYIYIYIYI